METLTFREWMELSEKEKGIRYKDLSSHDRFLARIQGPPEYLTEEEKKEIKEPDLDSTED